MYVGLKQPRGDGERYVTPARAAAKETINNTDFFGNNYCSIHLKSPEHYVHCNLIKERLFSIFFSVIFPCGSVKWNDLHNLKPDYQPCARYSWTSVSLTFIAVLS